MTTTLAKPPLAPREYRWTAEAFYKAADAGVFADPARLELIHGRIIEKMPQSPLHRACRVRISRLLRGALGADFEVADECPIHITFDGEPVPDIVVLWGQGAENEVRHPAPEEAALLVEIAISSVASDTGDKALLYAKAGIGDYWVVLPEARAITVHRDPTPDGYQSVVSLGAEEVLSPLAAPRASLAVRDLLGISG